MHALFLLHYLIYRWHNIFGDNMKTKLNNIGGGMAIGIINGLLGAGGGMIAVPLLKKSGMNQKEAHATSIALILPLSLVSSFIYIGKGTVSFGDALPYLLPGALGAVVGSFLLSKISDIWLKRIFGIFMIWAGFRLLLK